MNNKKREPIYIKLLKINVFLYFITGSSVLGIILNVILYHHLYNPNESKDVILIEIYYWIPATFFIVILINILKLFFIKQTNKQNPLPKHLKWKIILFGWWYSNEILYCYLKYKRWTFEEEQKNKICTININDQDNKKDENSSLISIDNIETNLTYYKYLQRIYKNVTLITANQKIEKYKINDNNLSKDYVIVTINLQYYDFWLQFLQAKTWRCFCIFSLNENLQKSLFSFKTNAFGDNNYYKYFKTLKGMTFWISKNFPQFNNTNN